MTLDHVAQRASGVVELARPSAPTVSAIVIWTSRTQARDHSGLEHRIAEAQREQVLHAFLTQVMIDPVDAVLGEDGADRVVDCARTLEIAAERLLQHHTVAGVTQPRQPDGHRYA